MCDSALKTKVWGSWIAHMVERATRPWGDEFEPHVGHRNYLKKQTKPLKKYNKNKNKKFHGNIGQDFNIP